jgi:phospholipid-binding lipoprotein MlaA
MRAHVFAACLAVSLAACATPPTDPEDRADFEAQNDPAEPTNRAVFEANSYLDRNAMKPVAEAYRDNMPDDVKSGIHNFLANLGEPVVALNDFLQGKPHRGSDALGRFMLNTIMGGFGTFDVARNLGLPRHDSDFGMTFAVWGIEEGPFVELPVFGPSNARDTAGLITSFLADPLFWLGGTAALEAGLSKGTVDAVDTRAEYLQFTDTIEKTALDPYAQYRSMYRQRRAAQIEKAKEPDGPTGKPIDPNAPATPSDDKSRLRIIEQDKQSSKP